MSKPWDLKERTMCFAVSILRFCRTLPATDEAAEIAGQLRRAGSSAGAHYWAATRNRSESDYINKVAGAIEEADESVFWLELLARTEISSRKAVQPLLEETGELLAIFTTSKATAIERRQRKRKKSPKPSPSSPSRTSTYTVSHEP